MAKCLFSFARLLLLLSLFGSLPVSAEVIFNEIMYHPSTEDPREEYIELLNTGTNTVDLTGYRLGGGVDLAFSNALTVAGNNFVPAASLSLLPGERLVIAANLTNFVTKYPGVTNIIGNWTGQLSNTRETISLHDAANTQVDSVSFADEGDWAIRQRGPLNLNFRGWKWFAAHDGVELNTATGAFEGGRSLELVNPGMPNSSGQNWLASTVTNGTPGQANSVAATNIAPLILDVSHFPTIPTPTNLVIITARVLDESTNGVAVSLSYRNHSTTNPPSFTVTTMFDDGAHNDGLAGDRIYAATIPAQTNGSIIEFYVSAVDAQVSTRTWPAAARQLDGSFAQTCNALYQVDENLDPPSASNVDQPFHRLVLTESERAEFQRLMSTAPDSNAEMNGTFISSDGTGTEVRYNVSVRIRGEGSRSRTPPNWRVNIPTDRVWNGLSAINLNVQFIHAQLAGSAFALSSGLPAAEARVVQVRLNGVNYTRSGAPVNGTATGAGFGCYALLEPINNEWAGNHFPQDGNGNVYRASIYPWYANLDYEGANVFNYTNATSGGYFKASNTSENDWSDLIQLTYLLSSNTPDANYVQTVGAFANLELFARYFAVVSALDYSENGLPVGVGDDYAMYRGVNDPRFILVPHDFDTILGQGDTSMSATRSIWRVIDSAASSASDQRANFVRRLLRHPDTAPTFFRELKRLCDTSLSSAQFNSILDQTLGGWVPDATIASMKTFAADRRASILSQLPTSFTVTTSLTLSNGYFRTTSASATVRGTANAIDTRTVVVGGSNAVWSVWEGRWTNSVSLQPGLNSVLVQCLDTNNLEIARTNITIWRDTGATANVGGTLAGNTTWTAAGGPYLVTNHLIIPSGVTLTIAPGTTVYLSSGMNVTVMNGGQLLAEGTDIAPIQFTVAPGSGVSWGNLTINGAAGSPETRIAFARFNGNGTSPCIEVAAGTVALDHLSFGNTTRQYLALDGASFDVSWCEFPTPTAAFEPVHGTGGIKSGGRGIIRNCFFGAPNGYNDVVDFTGGNRNLGQPIIQFYNNVFAGTADDMLDLDGTDAWVEGNIFLHAHKNGSPDSSSAVSGGSNGADTSEVTIVRNIFFDCDQPATAKQGNFYTLLNNTIIHTTKTGGLDTASAVLNFADDGTTGGLGAYLEGNIIVDAEALVRNYNNAVSTVTFTNNFMPFAWSGPGGGNSTNDARLKYIPQLSETQFGTWQAAQVLRDWFSLRPGSPAIGSGPNGLDCGAQVASDVSISGEPASTTAATSAALTVGTRITGNGMPVGGFPQGSGYTHYKHRLDSGTWSGETVMGTPITLSGLASGAHSVQVIGKNDAGEWQSTNSPTVSRTWTVNTALAGIRLNELLVRNVSMLVTNGEAPDVVELFNFGGTTVDLSGMGLTDDPATPYKYTFSAGTVLATGQFRVMFADNGADATRYLGFNLNNNGEALYLFAPAANGGALLDSVSFGPQIADFSIGRVSDNSWALCKPTIGSANVQQPTGSPFSLRINEWLASGTALAPDDFIELYNSDSAPVALGGLFLSDVPETFPAMNQIAALSFIPANGFIAFKADGSVASGAEHLNFKLAPEQGRIGLFASDLQLIDHVSYGPQTTGKSQGRQPNGGDTFATFSTPTPGMGNPPTATTYVTTQTLNLLPMTNVWRYNQTSDFTGVSWFATNYNDAAWQSGAALLYVEGAALPAPKNTALTLGRTAYYFRTTFNMPTNPAGFGLTLQTVLDDGAVIYLNGSELFRVAVTNATVGYASLASRTVGDAVIESFNIAGTNLHSGTNVLAVEVHQVDPASTDVVWGMALDATRNITNVINAPLALSEVLAAKDTTTNIDGSLTDWVELLNPNPTSVNLSGMSLSDDAPGTHRWYFPAGTTLVGGARLIVKFDALSPAATNAAGLLFNTGFSLNASGDAVMLYDASSSLLDSVTFGPQADGFSMGRITEVTGAWQLALPTPGSGNIAAETGDVNAVHINEWAASVTGGPDWFELHNPGPQPVAIDGLYLTDKLSNRTKHLIPALSFIGTATNGFLKFIADNDTTQGADHVGFSLDGGIGEALGLFPPGTGPAIDSVTFGIQAADVSEGRFPDGAATRVFFNSPSPGAANWLALTNIVINEVLTHTDPPLEDAVEIWNLSDSPVNIGGWWLSDDKDVLTKFQVPANTTIAPGSYAVFYEYQFNPEPGIGNSFEFSSSKGDSAWLSATDGSGELNGYRDHVKFGPQFNGVSFGRVPTSVGVDFASMQSLTFGTSVTAGSAPELLSVFRTGTGALNSGPRVGPVIISEIMYHPTDIGTNDNVRDEFVELYNASNASVPLYDPAHATNGWRLRGVDFDFNTNHVIAPGGFLLLVSFDPATNGASLTAFRAAYGTNGTLVGPYSGKLDNGGEAIELYAPDAPQTLPPEIGLVPYVLIDRVVYGDVAPWPTNADGFGSSLQRLSVAAYGNDPANWSAAAPSAGSIAGDSDGDGLPDAWEDAHGLNKLVNDAALDPDQDGFANWKEYLAGTDPQSAASALRFTSAKRNGNPIDLSFEAIAGKSYSILYRTQLASGSWQKLSNVPAQGTTQIVTVQDSANTNTTRFYQLVTPAIP